MAATRYPGYKCLVKGCGAKFARPNGFRTGLAYHVRTTHKDGALYAKGDLSVWEEGSEDGRYVAICERHGQCTNSDNLAWCKRLAVTDFCEVCAGGIKWCATCKMEENAYGACEGHDVIDDSVKARETAKILQELYGF